MGKRVRERDKECGGEREGEDLTSLNAAFSLYIDVSGILAAALK